jgi:tetratricopeptide (TPR) repeat protein
MTNEEAKSIYGQAMSQVDAGAFGEALDLFDALDAARPNSRTVMWQRARCLIELDRIDEARECCRRLEGKIEKERMDELRTAIAARNPAKTLPPEPAAEGANVLVIDAAYPASTNETTITGHVRSGVFRTGDTLTLVAPTGIPFFAPILRIGTGDTPINLVRAGQTTVVMLLQAEPHLVAPGSTATSEGQEESYAKTMVVSTGSGHAQRGELRAELAEAERLIKRGAFAQAREALETQVRGDDRDYMAYWMLARTWLEAEADGGNPARALECVRKAYEVGGASDPAVIHTLALALAASGQAEQGLRFLERLYESADLHLEARMALAQRIHEFRNEHQLGHVWEFADQYGEVVFESGNIAEIAKALNNQTAPRDAKCRRDHIGEWRSVEAALGKEYPEIAAIYAPPRKGVSGYTIALAALTIVVVLTIVFVLFR